MLDWLPWSKKARECRAHYATLSDRQISDLAYEKRRSREEPKIRQEARRAGVASWETMSYQALLHWWLDRYREEKRPDLLREARRLGVPNPGLLSTRDLDAAVLRRQVRKYDLQDLDCP